MKTIFDNIKKFRELKSVTRESMASDLGMSLSGYSKLERGEVDLTLSKLVKISQILNVSIEQLLNFDPSQIFNNKENYEVNNAPINSGGMDHGINDYKEKYIRLLENELERLRNLELDR
jgi:transcriptional regulator with XRE-family HTH domain